MKIREFKYLALYCTLLLSATSVLSTEQTHDPGEYTPEVTITLVRRKLDRPSSIICWTTRNRKI